MGVVAEVVDRALVMRNAQLMEAGEVNHIFYAPQEEYTKALLNAVPRLGSMANQELPAKF